MKTIIELNKPMEYIEPVSSIKKTVSKFELNEHYYFINNIIQFTYDKNVFKFTMAHIKNISYEA